MTAHFENISDYPAHSRQSANSDSQLRLALTVLRKRKWRIAAAMLVLAALSALVVWSIPPVYRASATLELEGQSSLINIDDVVASEVAVDEYLQTQVELMRTPQLAAEVVKKLSLTEHWELNNQVPVPEQFKPKNEIAKITARGMSFTKSGLDAATNWARAHIPGFKSDVPANQTPTLAGIEPEDFLFTNVVNKLMAGTRINAVKGTNKLFKVSYESRDPKLAALVANTYGELFVSGNAQSSISKTEIANERLTEKLEGLKLTLDKSENSVLNYMQENGLVDLRGNVQTLNEQEIKSVTDSLIQARIELQSARTLYSQVQSAKNISTEALALVPSISADPGVQLSRREVQETERKLNELSNKYLSKHPKVRDASSNYTTAKSNMELQTRIVADQIERNFRNAQSNYAALEQQLSGSKSVIQNLAEKQLVLNKLQQQAQTDRELYEIFFDRVRETTETLGLTPAIANFANLATPPLNPVRPNKSVIMLTVLMLGLLASIIAALSLEEFRDTIQGIHDVERKLGLGVLGVVPKVKSNHKWRNSDQTLVPGTIADPNGRFIESMRTLRTSLKLSANADTATTVLITSSVPEEGKSTVASNLAQAMAKTNRTLFIEADMRRPGISNSLKSTTPGLANLLSTDKFKPSECIQRSLFGNVDVITAGHVTDNSPELLANDSFAALINVFKNHYDWIIIDSAPVQAVSDALLIGQTADAALFIVRSDSTVSSVARRAIERLNRYKINVIGVVITQVDLDRIHGYGGDQYYQGYIDKYGYANKTKPIRKKRKTDDNGSGYNQHSEYTL